MSQLGLAFDSAVFSAAAITSTPSGRAVRSPDRTQHQVQQKQQEEPRVAVASVAKLLPEGLQDPQAYAEAQVRRARDRAELLYKDPEAQDRYMLAWVEGVSRIPGIVAALQEAAAEPPVEPASPKPVRAPARPPISRDPRSPRPSMPPQALRARAVVESEAPVPAGPRRPQPTVEEVLTKYRGLKPPTRRAQGGEG